MKRRTFIKTTSVIATGSTLLPFLACEQKPKSGEKLTNWAGNLEYSTGNISYPKSVEDIQKLVRGTQKVKALGSRHCFNTIADSKDAFISLKEMNKVVALDAANKTVTVEGGIRYGELAPYLHEQGFALHNLASLPHISVAGACSTGTHGSGVKNGNLSSAVSAIEFVAADGTVQTLTKARDGEKFNAAVVSLGALGVMTKVTLDLQPTFMSKQYVFEKLPFSQMKDHFESIMSAGYSVSLFTDWQNDYINEVWVKSLENDPAIAALPAVLAGAQAAAKNMHPIAELSAENCTEQMGVAGPWFERLPHFKMGFTPSSGKELQAEYFVPFSNAVAAIEAVQRMGKAIGPHLFISEIRSIAADNLWMSPCYQQPSVAIHFTWKQDWPAVSKLLPVIEKELAQYGVKPHWGKLFDMPAAVLQQRHPKFQEFKSLMAEYDPAGKFRNDFLNQYIF